MKKRRAAPPVVLFSGRCRSRPVEALEDFPRARLFEGVSEGEAHFPGPVRGAGELVAEDPAAIDLGHEAVKAHRVPVKPGVGADGHLAAAVETGEKAALGLHADARLVVLEPFDEPEHAFVIPAALDAESTLADSEYGLPVYSTSDWPVMGMHTGQEMADQSSGLRMVITYLAVYIGFILMLTTAAVLAIQQLSETTDSLPRYRRLATLGADRRMVLCSLKVQTGIYFILPLCVAACHSACALSVLNAGLFRELGVDTSGSTALAALVIASIYGAYLLVAYLTSRSMVKSVLR